MLVILSDIKGRVAEVCKMKRNPKIYFDRITIFSFCTWCNLLIYQMLLMSMYVQTQVLIIAPFLPSLLHKAILSVCMHVCMYVGYSRLQAIVFKIRISG